MVTATAKGSKTRSVPVRNWKQNQEQQMGKREWIYKLWQKHQHISKWNVFHVKCSVNNRILNPRTFNFTKQKSWKGWEKMQQVWQSLKRPINSGKEHSAEAFLWKPFPSSFLLPLSIDKLSFSLLPTCRLSWIRYHLTQFQVNWATQKFSLNWTKACPS